MQVTSGDPPDRFELLVDPDAEPADVDRFLDALDRLVERRLSQRNKNAIGARRNGRWGVPKMQRGAER